MPPPLTEGGLPTSSTKLEKLIAERITIVLENVDTVQNGNSMKGNSGTSNGQDNSTYVDLGETQRTYTYKEFTNC